MQPSHDSHGKIAPPQSLSPPPVLIAAFADRKDLLMALIDRSGRLEWVNQTFAEQVTLPIEQLLGQKFFSVLASGDNAAVQQAFIREQLLKGESFKFELARQGVAQSACWLLVDGQPIYDADGIVTRYSILATNITLRKSAEIDLRETKQALEQANQELESRVQQRTADLVQQKEKTEQALQQLQQAQLWLVQNEKMSSLGQLVAGVAHEVNNPVNFVYGNILHANSYAEELLHVLHLYQEQFPAPGATIEAELAAIDLEFLKVDFSKLMASMKMGAERIQEIVRSLRNFSRLDEAEVKLANIHEGIDSTLMILRNRLKPYSDRPEIQVLRKFNDLPEIECYPGQLNQVFMNILSNAIDALEESFRSKVALSQRSSKDTPEKIVQQFADLQAHPGTITIHTQRLSDRQVRISISDNGPGITPEVRGKLFDPFFTTKAVGKGTGLGLAISYQIVVEKHGGQIYCLSEPGSGTEFVIDLPILQQCFVG